jgi:hypothetical protein
MLKTAIFFLFGCSLYFGQSLAGSSSSQNNNSSGCTNCPINVGGGPGNGTQASTTDGGSGTQPDSGSTQQYQQARSNLNIYLNQGNLNLSLNQSDNKFNRYKIYDGSGNLKRDQIISATNSYTVDISDLSSGNYLIVVIETPSNTGLSKLFVKP